MSSDAAQLRPEPLELPIEWGEDIEANLDKLWLVKGILPRQGLALLYGHPGAGKSYLAIDIAMHVALGWSWNGCRTRQGVVVYVGAEGQRGLRNRIAAFKRHYRVEGPVPLAFVACSVDLHDIAADPPALKRVVRRAASRYDAEPALVLVDTVAKTLGKGRENTDDLATYVSNCGNLGTDEDCCVLLVHHRPKDASNNQPRGHGSLKAGVDTAILVEAGPTRSATITKQRDGEERELLKFGLLPVALGLDSDSDEVSSCVVSIEPATRGLAGEGDGYPYALSVQQKVVLTELDEALKAHGIAVPPKIPDGVINRGDVRAVVLARTFADRAIAALRTGSDSKTDSVRRSFRRAQNRLQSLQLIGLWQDFVWRSS